MFDVVTATSHEPVATGDVLVFPYPAGTVAADFTADGHKASSRGLMDNLSLDDGDFTLTFGASFVTMTYFGATSIPSGTVVRLELHRRKAANTFDDGVVRIRAFGGVGDDVTDNTTAAANARAAAGDRPIVLDNGDYNVNQTTNIYPEPPLRDAAGTMWSLGTQAAPSARYEPVLYIEKVMGTIRDPANPDLDKAYDGGCLYAQIDVKGTAYTQALTGFMRKTGGDFGQHVGVHGRGRLEVVGSAFGMWAVAEASSLVPATDRFIVNGLEANTSNSARDVGWLDELATGASLSLGIGIVNIGTHPSTWGVRISAHGVGSGSGFYTGILFDRNSIEVEGSGLFDNGEAIRIKGPTDSLKRSGGIWFHGGHHKYALRTLDATFAESTIGLFQKDQVMRWLDAGATTTAGQPVFGFLGGKWRMAGAGVNVDSFVQINGTTVLGPQEAAIANAASGTEITTINAILAAMRSHGLIAT